jgi:hypothetical protein
MRKLGLEPDRWQIEVLQSRHPRLLLNAGDWPTLPGPAPSANGRKDRPAQAFVQLGIGTMWAKFPELQSLSTGTCTNDITTRSAEQAAAVDRLFREAHEVRPAGADCANAGTDPLLDDPGSADALADWLSESPLHPGVGPAAGTPSAWQTAL